LELLPVPTLDRLHRISYPQYTYLRDCALGVSVNKSVDIPGVGLIDSGDMPQSRGCCGCVGALELRGRY